MQETRKKPDQKNQSNTCKDCPSYNENGLIHGEYSIEPERKHLAVCLSVYTYISFASEFIGLLLPFRIRHLECV